MFIAAEMYENGFKDAVTGGQNQELLTKKYFCVDILRYFYMMHV